MNNSEYGLIIRFTDPSESFTAGYEAGMIHRDLENRISQEGRTVHKCNKDTIVNICRNFKRKAIFEDVICDCVLYDGYLLFTDGPLMELVK